MTIIECENVTKIYQQSVQKTTALDGISLTIEKGEFVALAGPSGSGKTTLLNIVGGLDRADEGRVVLDGTVLNGMSGSRLAELRLRKVGFVFQAFNLIPVLSALENVEFVMLLQGIQGPERLERARAVLDEVGLQGMHGRRPAELSGGQQQRVAVARAIVGNPSIILADEPTANLDSKTGARLLEIMKEMNSRRNITFVFSTHDRMVMEYASRLVRLQDGRICDE
jgi:putative ABC transport system ATP-binding protein